MTDNLDCNGTTAPASPAGPSAKVEFGRIRDVVRIFGIKKGSVYNLISDGRIRSFLVRSRGVKSGIRLVDLDSVRQLILSSSNN